MAALRPATMPTAANAHHHCPTSLLTTQARERGRQARTTVLQAGGAGAAILTSLAETGAGAVLSVGKKVCLLRCSPCCSP